MKFSAKYLPTTLFSLKDSNATNSGAKSLFLPSPYAIKMAILNQAITVGNDLQELEHKKSLYFSFIRDVRISFFIEQDSSFAVNNTFVKILKPSRSSDGFAQTVAFREYIFISKPLEIIFETQSLEQKEYLQKYLHKINYFGKKGCFVQFVDYSDNPNEANVKSFNIENLPYGVLQEYDDFEKSITFEKVNNYSSLKTIRRKEIMVLPLQNISSSKGFSIYKQI